MKDPQHHTRILKEKAAQLGFDACRVARANALTGHEQVFANWLAQEHQGRMSYMKNHFEKRLDPRLLVEGAQSVVVVAMNYYPPQHQPAETKYRIARYAYGRDYHLVIKDKLQQLADALSNVAGEHNYRIFSDSAPVLERSWAQESGLGNTGKNACLILPRKGSYYFLGELITSLELHPDEPFRKDLCGTCTKCMDACPTGAIIAPGQLDARKCISYLTIELNDPIPDIYRNKTEGWVFGCDICQEVCPHNRHAKPHQVAGLMPLSAITEWKDHDWETCTRTMFNKYIRNSQSPLSRIKYEKLMDNITCANASSQ
ncbi:MAG: tRNA epoxyqueuosine(34) reductase QueG [Bacteroidota bacterium]